jgi:putative nucleotidyltransferase with HDIG domain
VSTIVGGIGVGGIAAGALWLWLGLPLEDWIGLAAIAVLVGLGQALALDVDEGSISAAAVGALAGAAVFGPRAALAVAAAAALVDLAARRSTPRHAIFNTGALTFASLAASGVFALHVGGPVSAAVSGLAGGAVYFAVNVGLLSLVVAADDHERPLDVWRNRFAWLLPHYIAYGFIASVMALAYETAHIYALIVFALPLLLIRTTQGSYVKHTRKSTEQLRGAAEKISEQNQSLERANELLKEWSTAAMESLSATVDARDAYTAGHSRRVRLLALEIGEELGLSKPELELLGYAALFHDIGKLAVPDSILQKAGPLTEAELEIVKLHAGEGAKIVSRLGFLNDAVPAILHHHERFDGTGYPDGLSGSDIPYGARIIHVADALDSIMTARTYRPARSLDAALGELRGGSGRQFCPRCVDALLRIVERDGDGSIAALLEEESAGAIGSVRLTVIDGGKDPEAGRGRGGLEPPAPPVHASL